MIQSYGKITPTPGTPVRATANLSAPSARLSVHGVLIQVLPSNSGRVYIGMPTMNRATFTDLYAMLPVPAGAALPAFSAALTLAPNAVNVNDLWIDCDVGGDGVIITALIA